ncbi:MAG: hypothetical protein H8E14_11550 [Candidatus Marinimicrobia bacterium]|nr:hypothetical protein [Candidatus Neomarinimicrobiota bacterium]
MLIGKGRVNCATFTPENETFEEIITPLKRISAVPIISIVVIMLSGFGQAASWQVTLTSGEKFRRIEQLYLNETTLYLVSYGIASNELPIPVYVGDIKSIKQIRHNRFLGLSCSGYLGWLFGGYLYNELAKSDNQRIYSIENAATLGMLSGLLLGRLVCVSKTRLLHMTVEERKLIIHEILFLDSLQK